MKRDIITIDEERCNGCGECVPNCPEGAIRIIDGKARLISDLFCDGLGACIGECPQGAISIEKREAEPYDERRVMENVVKQGENTIRAHLQHLRDHGESGFYNQAIEYLQENGFDTGQFEANEQKPLRVCPGVASLAWAEDRLGEQEEKNSGGGPTGGEQELRAEGPGRNTGRTSGKNAGVMERSAGELGTDSALTHWPVQMHLINPSAPHYRGSDLLLAAYCAAFSMGGFHSSVLSGKTLAVACPKLDSNQERYLEKLVALIDEARINTLTVLVMEVPCCRGLLVLAQKAAEQASRKVPIKLMVASVQGELLKEEWI
jgi:ferredoxin